MTACDRCGRTAEGFAMIGDRRLCHPDYGPSCYVLASHVGGLNVLDALDADPPLCSSRRFHHLQSITTHGRWVCMCGRRGPRSVGGEIARRLWSLHVGRRG